MEYELIAKGIRFVADTETIPGSSIDTVICHHALGHTVDPCQVLMEIKRFLREDGRLILVVPYENERRCRVYRKDEPNHHLFSWNIQTLGNLGFSIRESSLGKYGYDRYLAVPASRLRLGAAGFRVLKLVMMKIIPLLEVRIVATRRGTIGQGHNL